MGKHCKGEDLLVELTVESVHTQEKDADGVSGEMLASFDLLDLAPSSMVAMGDNEDHG